MGAVKRRPTSKKSFTAQRRRASKRAFTGKTVNRSDGRFLKADFWLTRIFVRELAIRKLDGFGKPASADLHRGHRLNWDRYRGGQSKNADQDSGGSKRLAGISGLTPVFPGLEARDQTKNIAVVLQSLRLNRYFCSDHLQLT